MDARLCGALYTTNWHTIDYHIVVILPKADVELLYDILKFSVLVQTENLLVDSRYKLLLAYV